MKISVVINTLNEEKNIGRAINSIKDFADEIIVCDMESEDKTVEIAKKLGAMVISHKRVGYVEPARNFALRQAQHDWIMILDADEEVPQALIDKLKSIIGSDATDYVLIPRKNIIFGKWIENARWWPDYNIRFFKKGKVTWKDEIHSIPAVEGIKQELEPVLENALIHYNYNSIDQYLERLFRYTKIQAEEKIKNGYEFNWPDIIRKPMGEFLSRYFAGEGYKEGIHGLVLSLMQAISEFVVYIRVWEKENFFEKEIATEAFSELSKSSKELNYWIEKGEKNLLKKFLHKIL